MIESFNLKLKSRKEVRMHTYNSLPSTPLSSLYSPTPLIVQTTQNQTPRYTHHSIDP